MGTWQGPQHRNLIQVRNGAWGGTQSADPPEWNRCNPAGGQSRPVGNCLDVVVNGCRRLLAGPVEQNGEDLARRDAVYRGVMQRDDNGVVPRQTVDDLQPP